MRCSNCKHENKAGRKFCSKCGTPLENICPKCGHKNDPEDEFCGNCGTRIEDTKREDDIAAKPSPDAERR